MKVLCIKDNWEDRVYTFGITPPVFGKEYTVINERPCLCGRCSGRMYVLAEYGTEFGFITDYFSPISDIDEKEMQRENIFQTQNS